MFCGNDEPAMPPDKLSNETQKIDDGADQLFLRYIEDAKKKEEDSDASYKKVPKFYQKSQASQNQLGFKVRHEARNRFLKHKTSEVLDKEDMELLYQLLRENYSPPHDGKERINYNSFLTIASKLPMKCRDFFSASTFLKFDRDEYGRIDVQSFFHSIVRKNNLFQTRIHISLYDLRRASRIIFHHTHQGQTENPAHTAGGKAGTTTQQRIKFSKSFYFDSRVASASKFEQNQYESSFFGVEVQGAHCRRRHEK